jgi:hypothetical protein
MTMLQDLAALVYEFNKADRRKPGFGGEAADMARRFVCQTAKLDRTDTQGTIEAKLAAALTDPVAADTETRRNMTETTAPAKTAESGVSPERILSVVRSVDEWLDAEDGEQYQSQPLARTWARVAKVSNEANEALEALSCATGQNPRKGTCKTEDDVLSELADTILTAFVAIRHITEDDATTWSVVTAGFEKAAGRVATGPPLARE